MFKQNRIKNLFFLTILIFLIIIPSIGYGQIGSRDLTQEYCIKNWRESPDVCAKYIQKNEQSHSQIQSQKQNQVSTQTTNPNPFVIVFGIISAIVLVFVIKKMRKNTVNSYKQNYYRYDEQYEQTKQKQGSEHDESREEQRREEQRREEQRREEQRQNNSSQPNQGSLYLKKYYDVLEIEENANGTEIKSAFRKLVNFYHPDKFANKSVDQQKYAEEKTKKIYDAYDELKKAGKVE